jgi:hypothetical protein
MKKLLIMSLVLSLHGHALNVTCSLYYPPYYLSDEAIVAMAWWQMTTGAFAILMTANNFVAAWYYFYKKEKRLAPIIKAHALEITKENEHWQKTIPELKKLLNDLKRNNHEVIDENDNNEIIGNE